MLTRSPSPAIIAKVETRVSRISHELFSLLEDATDEGGSYLHLTIRHPDTGEPLTLVLARPEVKVVSD